MSKTGEMEWEPKVGDWVKVRGWDGDCLGLIIGLRTGPYSPFPYWIAYENDSEVYNNVSRGELTFVRRANESDKEMLLTHRVEAVRKFAITL